MERLISTRQLDLALHVCTTYVVIAQLQKNVGIVHIFKISLKLDNIYMSEGSMYLDFRLQLIVEKRVVRSWLCSKHWGAWKYLLLCSAIYQTALRYDLKGIVRLARY